MAPPTAKMLAGLPPSLGDYPKVTISLPAEIQVVTTFFGYLASESPRIATDGPRWQLPDQERFASVGILVSRALRAQEERVLAGEAPIIAPVDEQERVTLEFYERLKAGA
jgi:hypothetical protein